MSQAGELDPARETERAEQPPPDLVLADCVTKVFFWITAQIFRAFWRGDRMRRRALLVKLVVPARQA